MERIGASRSLGILLAAAAFLLLSGVGHCYEQNGAIVLTAKEIAQMKANKMADLLNHVPGVNAGETSVSIHGSSKVRVLVDGRPINDPTSSYGAVNWSMVDPDQVERIEIFRGKGGVRYGQDAGGGVILVTTKKIQAVHGSIKTYGGNHETGFASASVQGNHGYWSAEMGGEVETTQGFKVNNDKDRQRGSLKLAYTRDEDRGLNLGLDFVHVENGLSGQPDYPTPHSRKESSNTVISAQARGYGLTSSTFFNTGEQHSSDTSRGLDKRLRVNELGQDISGDVQTGDWGRLSYGTGYRLSLASGTTFSDQSEEVFSLFVSENLYRSESPWSLTFGVRANANSAFDNVLNPEVKLIYRQPDWSLSASYSGSNNIPSFYQRYNHTSSTIPNPNLGMETAQNYSLALAVKLHPSLSLRTSLFYNQLSDRITYVTGSDGVGQYENFGDVTYRGGDLAFSWQPDETLNFKLGYTYLRAIDEETGLYISAKADHTATFDCTWQLSEQFTTVFSSKYVSEVFRDRANTRTIPEYWLANIRAEYKIGRYALFTEIENIENTTYYYADGLLGPSRSWIAGISWKM